MGRTHALPAAATLALTAALSFAGAATAAPGDVDPSFGSGGAVLTGFGDAPGGPRTTDGVVQPDGKIVVVAKASFSTALVLRFNPDGTLDPSFGAAGIASLNGYFASMALYPDGKILLSGGAYNGPGSVVRLLPDGRLDPTFGSGAGGITVPEGEADSVVVTPSGGAVVQLARTRSFDCSPRGYCQMQLLHRVLRIDLAGNYDPSFGGGDGLTDEVEGYRGGVALQPDGRVVDSGSGLLRRYNADGSLDTSFGIDGVATVAGELHYSIRAPTIAPDGSIVVLGNQQSPAIRFTPSGALDRVFDTTPTGIQPRTVEVESDGSVLVGGYSASEAAIARFDPSGQPDLAFGGGDGVASTAIFEYYLPVANFFGADEVLAIGQGPGGRLVGIAAAGGKVGIAAFDATGAADPSLGPRGTASYALRRPSRDEALAVDVAPDGSVIAGGITDASPTNDSRSRFALARYLPSGALDPSFGDGGRVIAELGGFHAGPQTVGAVKVAADGKIIVLGNRYQRDGSLNLPVSESVLLRLLPDGTPDPSFGGGDGIAVSRLAHARGLLLEADGSIVIADTIHLQRFLAGGTLDPGFQTGGGTEPEPPLAAGGGNEPPRLSYTDPPAVRQTPDGGFLLGAGNAITRFNPDGTRDTRFGGLDATVKLPLLEAVRDVRVAGGGRILVISGASNGDNLLFHRLTAAGKADLTFGPLGRYAADLGDVYQVKVALFAPDGRVLLAGPAKTGEVGVQRLEPNGRHDPLWHVHASGEPVRDSINALALAPGGEVVVAGGGLYPNDRQFAVARFAGGGPPPVRCGSLWATQVGTAGDDMITGTGRRDILTALGGNDVLRGLGGDDVLCGGTGNDRLLGGSGGDGLYGGPGRDSLYGGFGNDRLHGGPGRDSLAGGPGLDSGAEPHRRVSRP